MDNKTCTSISDFLQSEKHQALLKSIQGPASPETAPGVNTIDPEHEARLEKALDARARRAAKRLDLIAIKSRRGIDGLNNHGGFMLADRRTGIPIEGFHYEWDAQDVIDYCADVEGAV